MTPSDVYTHFENEFKFFYDKFYSEIKTLYSNGEVSNEPMPRLKNAALREILAVVHSCLVRSNYENHDEYWLGAFIAVHIASRQILNNGNKRLSLLVLCFFLDLYSLRLVFEKIYYAEMIKDFIETFEEKGAERAVYMEDYINALADEIKNNSMKQPYIEDSNKSLRERIRNLFPF